jgi:hypothetical protein
MKLGNHLGRAILDPNNPTDKKARKFSTFRIGVYLSKGANRLVPEKGEAE